MDELPQRRDERQESREFNSTREEHVKSESRDTTESSEQQSRSSHQQTGVVCHVGLEEAIVITEASATLHGQQSAHSRQLELEYHAGPRVLHAQHAFGIVAFATNIKHRLRNTSNSAPETTFPFSSSSSSWTPKNGKLAAPGFIGVAPGDSRTKGNQVALEQMGCVPGRHETIMPPVSVCQKVSVSTECWFSDSKSVMRKSAPT